MVCHHGGMTSTTALTIRVPGEMAEALRTHAFLTNTSSNEVVKRAVAEYLQTHGRSEAVEAAFEQVREQHAVALDKLADL